MKSLGLIIALGCFAVLCIVPGHSAEAWPEGLSFVGLKEGRWQLYVVPPGADSPQPVTTLMEPRTPTYNARLGTVAYIGADGNLREVSLKESVEHVLPPAGAKHAYTQPRYDQDGKRLFVVILKEGASTDTDIAVFNQDRRQRQSVITQPLAQFEPYFQPPTTLYYAHVACNIGCGAILQEIWRLNIASGQAEQVTLLNAMARQPVVSPDGRSLYFASNKAGYYHLWRLVLDSGRYEQLTTGAVTDSDPALSPQGTLYFIRHTPEGVQLMRRLADGILQALSLPQAFEDLRDLEITP